MGEEEVISIKRIKKRNGDLVLFDEKKITEAVFKAVKATGEDDYDIAKQVSKKVTSILNIFFKAQQVPNVESIQDLVEKTLMEEGYTDVAKHYILYRAQHKKLRETKALTLDIKEMMDGYLEQADWRVNENSNIGFSFSGLLMHTASSVIAHYTLSEIYPKEVSDAHRKGEIHIHDLGFGITGYCAGWSLRQLIEEGFNGIPGRTESVPARHMDALVWQIINFIGTLQNEWAGAQAFSSFDTYLAPFVKVDNLNYKQVKQNIQAFVFNMNISSRWGSQCVSEDTECLTEKGWKIYKEIKPGDQIATFNIKSKRIEYLPALMVKSYEFDGKLIHLKNRTQDQLLTPDHKVVRKRFNSPAYELIEAYKLIKFKTPVLIPNSADIVSKKTIKEEWLKLFAWLVAEGSFSDGERQRVYLFQSLKNDKNIEEIRTILTALGMKWDESLKKGGFSTVSTMRFRLNQESSRRVRKEIVSKKIPEIIKTLSTQQIRLFLETYIKGDGHKEKKGRIRIYTKDSRVRDAIQELCALCSWGSTTLQRKTNKVWVINIIRNSETAITSISKKSYKGYVWCPTTKNGTFVARRKGKVFITGNTPFSNITLDWVVPDDMKEKKAIVAGKEQDFTYGDCQKEMDMLNKAFIEVMTAGDAKGRIFTFPIPTYNVTRDFNWDNENAKLLFEMTAKYGIPYFQNFVNSSLNPSDVRSMCLHPEEEIIVKIEGVIKRLKIGELVESYSDEFDSEGWSKNNHTIQAVSINPKTLGPEWMNIKNFLKKKSNTIITIIKKGGKEIRVTPNHLIPVLEPEGIIYKLSQDIEKGDILMVSRNISSLLNKEYERIGEYVLEEEMAKFIGFFLAEGNFLRDSRKKWYGNLRGIQFTFHEGEKEYLAELSSIIQNLFNYEPKIRSDPRYPTKYVYIYNAELTKKLAKHFNKEKVPEQLFNSPKSVISSFLAYFFKGDGYSRGGDIHINSPISRDLTLLHMMVDIPVTYNLKSNSQNIRLQHANGRGSKGVRKVDILHDLIPIKMVDLSEVHGARRSIVKKNKFVGKTLLKRYGGYERVKDFFEKGIALLPVRAVIKEELENPKNFYDLELERNHIFLHSLGSITHNCCRLQMNTRELKARGGGLFGSGELTGSLGVVTINMARIGYLSKSKEEFFKHLKHFMDIAKTSLEIKRKIVQKNMDNGLMPFSKRYLGNLNNHFNTIGLLGMNEALLNFMNTTIASPEGIAFAEEVLVFMRDRLSDYQEETGNLYNLEATPGEGTSYRFAKIDKKEFPNIITAGIEESPYYTNSTQLPVHFTQDIFEALELQDPLQIKYTGGTVLHGFLGEKVSDAEACKKLVKRIAYNFRLPYFTITPTFSICPVHGYLPGEHEFCPFEETQKEVNEDDEMRTSM